MAILKVQSRDIGPAAVLLISSLPRLYGSLQSFSTKYFGMSSPFSFLPLACLYHFCFGGNLRMGV